MTSGKPGRSDIEEQLAKDPNTTTSSTTTTSYSSSGKVSNDLMYQIILILDPEGVSHTTQHNTN